MMIRTMGISIAVIIINNEEYVDALDLVADDNEHLIVF